VPGAERAGVERLLARVVGRRVRVVGSEGLGGPWAPVARLTLDAAYAGLGRTVVVKWRRRGGEGWGYDPANLRNEYAAGTLLGELGAGVAPRILGGDDRAGLLVMTDLGPGPSVEELLFAGEPSAATTGLLALARATGTMHAAAVGAADTFEACRAAFAGAGVAPVRLVAIDQPLDRWGAFCRTVEELGFPAPRGVSGELDALDEALRQPGPFVTLTHGDLTPNNALLVGHEARLIDFEGAAFRHAGLDAACLRLPFPQYGRWAVLPANVLAGMDLAYRQALAEGCPSARQHAAYLKAVVTGCATWTIVRTYRLRLIGDPQQPPDEAIRRRTQIVHTIEAFVAVARQAGSFPALASWFVDLSRAMRDRWPEANHPPRRFPAFDGAP
jgi:hypothetical protein